MKQSLKTLFCFVLIIINTSAFAHNNELIDEDRITLGTPYQVIDAKHKIYLKADDYVVAFKYDDQDDLILQSFDTETMTEVARVEYDNFDDKAVFNRIAYINQKILLFYSLYNDNANVEQLFVAEFDPKTVQLMGAPKSVLSVQGKVIGNVSGTIWKAEVTGKFYIRFNANQSAFMVKYKQKTTGEQRDSKLAIHVFDSYYKELWKEEDAIFSSYEKTYNYGYILSNVQSVYVLTKDYFSDKKSRNPNYTFKVVELNASGEYSESEEIKFENRYVESIRFILRNGKIMLGGYYSTYNTDDPEGVFNIELDTEGKIVRDYHEQFTLAFVQKHATEKRRKNAKENASKNEHYIPFLVLNQMIWKADNSVILVGQLDWMTTQKVKDSNGQYSEKKTYYKGNIYVSKIANSEKDNWMNVVPTLQRSFSLGYELINGDDALKFLYFDNEDNLNLSDDQAPIPAYYGAKKGGFRLNTTKLDLSTGEAEKESLFMVKKVKDLSISKFDIKRIEVINNEEIIVEVYKKKKEDILLKVQLN